MNGKPFEELSTGEQMLVGLDLVNGMQKYKFVKFPLLIDSIGELSQIPNFINQQIIACRTMPVLEDIEENRKYNEAFKKLNQLRRE